MCVRFSRKVKFCLSKERGGLSWNSIEGVGMMFPYGTVGPNGGLVGGYICFLSEILL